MRLIFSFSCVYALSMQKISLEFYIDIHAHSTMMNGFMYGNIFEEEERFQRQAIFPKLLCQNAEDFSFVSDICFVFLSYVGISDYLPSHYNARFTTCWQYTPDNMLAIYNKINVHPLFIYRRTQSWYQNLIYSDLSM